MKLLLGVFLFAGALCADTIYPPLPPVPPGSNVGYGTQGSAGGILWTAGWFPDGVNQSVWAIGFSESIASYTVVLHFESVDSLNGAYVSGVSTITEDSNWINGSTLQLSGVANPETWMYILVGGGAPPTINFTRLSVTTSDAPEPKTAVLAGLGLFVLTRSRRWLRYSVSSSRVHMA